MHSPLGFGLDALLRHYNERNFKDLIITAKDKNLIGDIVIAQIFQISTDPKKWGKNLIERMIIYGWEKGCNFF